MQPESPNGDDDEAEPPNDVIVAVKKIMTLRTGEQNQWIVFSTIAYVHLYRLFSIWPTPVWIEIVGLRYVIIDL